MRVTFMADDQNSAVLGCVAEEISHLKKHHESKCKIIESVGDFAYIITIQLQIKNLSLKFQLTKQYPDVVPAIIPTSNSLSNVHNSQLSKYLMEKSEEFVGKPMIQNLIYACLQWVTENQSDITEPVKEKGKPIAKHSKKKRSLKNEEDKIIDKKPAMKTASDVISRIQWDENLKSEDFIVGYMDRFVGIIEKSFDSFSWEDISTVNYYTLAIPKHRIFYFKYKTIKVWDKVQRLDLVFGSTGSKITITDIVSNYEEQLKRDMEENLVFESDSQYEMPSDPNFFCDDEFCAKITQPNFFVALRITNEEILKKVAWMQEDILKNKPTYFDCFIPPVCLHLTLCMLRLDHTHQIADATNLLKNLQEELSKTVADCDPIRIKNVYHFSHRVVYGCIKIPEELTDLVQKLKCYFFEEKLLTDINKNFVPHMTIMKLTRQVSKLTESNQIDPSIYEQYMNCDFGDQAVDNLYLCSTDKIRQDDGFYMSTINLKL
ncbi:leukocyte receptor cluster member 9-like [Octopus vulgaris]|uniref:Leukocyte receptor cluster member 9-like n=1 Tax=Octopus vulgaris TaxID=6645 RepID=A0AA36AVF8_OCTVU|nr:leukocyte receptor cluster member 9-like [Octopus vulgaris]